MTPSLHLWLIPVLPLVGAAINGFFGRRFSRQIVAAVALTSCGVTFVQAVWVWAVVSFSRDPQAAGVLTLPHTEFLAHWIRSGTFLVNFDFYLDQLTLVMLLVVTGVGFLIHIYSVGYMWARRRLLPLLRLPESVHVLHAHVGAGRQLSADVRRLGGRGPRAPIC